MLFSGKNRALASLSHFAGRHLAFASRIVLESGYLTPFGMKLTLSRWSGATEETTLLVADDPKLIPAIAEHWFMTDHDKAKFVSVAIDSFSTVDGARTAAVIISARPKDFSSRILVFLPYAPQTENSPTVLGNPRVDFPPESLSLVPKRDLIMANLLRGRDSFPMKKSGV
jgi:hypothetical protein